MRIFLDIETLPGTDEPDYGDLIDPADVTVHDDELRPDGRLKDPAKIAADLEKKREKLLEKRRADAVKAREDAYEHWARGSLSAIRGRVYCVGVAVDYAEPVVICGGTEEDTLASLQSGLKRRAGDRPILTTWNGNGFDLPYLAKRALRYELWTLASICRRKKQWDEGDLFKTWLMGHMRGEGKLDDVAAMLGIERPDNPIHGADVLDAYLDGRGDEIVAHCKDDVRTLQRIAEKFANAGWI